MEIELVGLKVEKLFVDKIKVLKARLEHSLLKEGFSSLYYVPMILKLIQTSIISHKIPEKGLSNLLFLTFHQVLNTNVIHVPVC